MSEGDQQWCAAAYGKREGGNVRLIGSITGQRQLSRSYGARWFVSLVGAWPEEDSAGIAVALKQIVDAQGDVAGVVMSRVVSKRYRQYSYGDPFLEAKSRAAGART